MSTGKDEGNEVNAYEINPMTTNKEVGDDEGKRKFDVGEVVKTTLNLMVFCFLVAFLLSFFNQMTYKRIEANAKAEEERIQSLLIDADKFEPIEGFADGRKAFKDGKPVGYVVKASPRGYGGPIVLMFSVTPEFKVKDVAIVDASKETPGLGDRIKESMKIGQFKDRPFVSQFENKGVNQLELVSERDFNDRGIAAITGATISSRAVTRGIREGMEKLVKTVGTSS